jgi:predicted amidohydrolase
VRIALGQLISSPKKEETLASARRAIREARRGDADLLLLPEVYMAFLDRSPGVTRASVAEPLDGPYVAALGAEARAHGLYVGCGLWETAPGERVRAFNTTVLIAPDGSPALVYRKTHLYDAFGYRESDYVVPGDEPPGTVRTPLGALGLLVCYELRFPELTRALALDGAEVVLLPAAWVAGPRKEAHWETLIQARAIENTVFVAAADQAGNIYVGGSRIVDPMGIAIAAAGATPGLVFGDVDLERIRQVRETLPLLAQRRETLYARRAPAASSRGGAGART